MPFAPPFAVPDVAPTPLVGPPDFTLVEEPFRVRGEEAIGVDEELGGIVAVPGIITT